MAATTIAKNLIKSKELKQMQIKASLFDEFIEFFEDKYLGHLMNSIEKEQNLSLLKSKKMMKK